MKFNYTKHENTFEGLAFIKMLPDEVADKLSKTPDRDLELEINVDIIVDESTVASMDLGTFLSCLRESFDSEVDRVAEMKAAYRVSKFKEALLDNLEEGKD